MHTRAEVRPYPPVLKVQDEYLLPATRGKDVLTLAKEMLENFGSLYGLLTSEYEQFSGVHGIGVAKFAQLKGIAELARRYYNVRMREESPLLSPEMTREFLQSQLTGEEREIFMVIFLDSQMAYLTATSAHRPYCAPYNDADRA